MEKITYRIRKLKFDRITNNFIKEYSEISDLSDRNLLNNFVMQKREALYLHAYNHIRYYHHLFQKIGLINNGIIDHSQIDQIPILTKDLIRKNHGDLISDDCQTRKWYYNSSGGSTGEPIRLIQDENYLKWGSATNYYYFKNILEIEEPIVKKVVLWGSERDLFTGRMEYKAKIQNWFSNTVFLNSFRMTNQDIERYIQTINSFKPEIIRGYAGSLFELCKYAEKKKIPLYTPKIVVSAAENLSEVVRNVIESNFGSKVFNFYGSREIGNLAGECREGTLHPFSFWNYLEVVNIDNQPVNIDEEGRIIVTNFYNYSMPLIRYEIGDMAILGPEKCLCGIKLPTLKRVTGRITDHFILENRTIIHGEYFTHLFYLKDWVKVFQVIQEDYLKIRILIVITGKINSSDQIDIENKIKLVMGSNCKIIWDIVDEIPKTRTGKYLYTKSLVPR
jgi:phenylacetate-CoA ligase